MAANASSTFNSDRKVLNTLQNLPFDSLIAAPLNACVNAQAEAAQSTINFIQSVGLNEDENGNKQAVYVYFNFIQGGRRVTISVPLLTMIPIPYIAINTIDINFKAKVTGVQNASNTASESYEDKIETSKKESKLGWFKVTTTKINTEVSTKKDSTSTKDSGYSVEATIDVAVHASQDSMPAGMAKILEMLGSAMDLCDPNGELTVNETYFELGPDEKEAKLIVTYKTPKGVYDPKDIYIEGAEPESVDEITGTATYMLEGKSTGVSYTVASKTSTRKIEVVVKK
jgi:hypothetical protein